MENPKCYNLNMAPAVAVLLRGGTVYLASSSKFWSWEWIFCLRSGISDFIENVGYDWDWKDKNLSPSVPLWCSMYSVHVSAGFWGLSTSSRSSHFVPLPRFKWKQSIPLNIIVSASKFSKLKRGSGICNCCGNFTNQEKTRYCWDITML